MEEREYSFKRDKLFKEWLNKGWLDYNMFWSKQDEQRKVDMVIALLPYL